MESHPDRIKVIYGDTALTPYSTGTHLGSRSIVMAGGAVALVCRQLAKRIGTIGAHFLQCDETDVFVTDGKVIAGNSAMSIEDVAHIWYARPHELPSNVDAGGLEVTAGYKPARHFWSL